MLKSDKCRRRIIQWNIEFLEAVRQLSNANSVDALRSLGIRANEAARLIELTSEQTHAIATRVSMGTLAKKVVDLVDIKSQWSVPVGWDASHELETVHGETAHSSMHVSGAGKALAKAIITRINAAFLLMAKDITSLDRGRAQAWVDLSSEECDLIERLTTSEILSPNSIYQRQALVTRSVNLNLICDQEKPSTIFKSHAATIAGNIVFGGIDEHL
jgi:hypothetical protein